MSAHRRGLPSNHESIGGAIVAALRPKNIVFRSSHLRDLNEHAIELATRLRIQVTARQFAGGGCAHHGTRAIECPPVTNESSYAVFLHEVGHLESPQGDSRQYRHSVSDVAGRPGLIAIGGECGAWRWAMRAAKMWTREMHGAMSDAMRFYASYADADEKDEIVSLLSDSAIRIADKPITFAQLDEQIAAVRGR